MKPEATEEPQDRLFQNRRENMINMDHGMICRRIMVTGKTYIAVFAAGAT
jgi:phosphate starvation-inducible protein PhoH